MSAYRTLNPASGELLATYPEATDAEVEAVIGRAEKAFSAWRLSSHAERRAPLEAVANLLESRADEFAELMAVEMGKLIAEGAGEARKCAWVCRYYAERAETFLAPEAAESDGSEAWVRYEPLGPVLAIMPWNFPFWQVFRAAAPALAAGNPVLLKHAPNTPGSALAIERLFREAGLPDGLFQNLFLSNDQAATAIAHPAVRGVTLTGSTRAGREVAALAGRHLKPMVLELGGSDPFVVFADADIDEAVRIGVLSRCLNAGQSCIAAKRFLVERPIFDRFAAALSAAMAARRVGDPTDPETTIGPLARADLRDQLARQVIGARRQGARELLSIAVAESRGFYYPPQVLTDLDPRSDAAREEMFGPVAQLFPFRDEEEAVTIANATPYGLGASLWTDDRRRVDRLVSELATGSVFVNGLVKSDPRLPFGGIRDSGFGRELARAGLHEFVNVKTVWIK